MDTVRPVPKEAKINRAEAAEPRAGHRAPAGKAHGSEVGNETHADMRGAMDGQPTDRNPLHGATKELKEQHPIEYHDHGPHHGTDHHVRHMPLHGMKPTHGYGR